jgi:hypothetical protein
MAAARLRAAPASLERTWPETESESTAPAGHTGSRETGVSRGVSSISGGGYGLLGQSTQSNAVYGDSSQDTGVIGITHSAVSSGALGSNSAGGPGVTGLTAGSGPGVLGQNAGSGPGVLGQNISSAGDGVEGQTDGAFNSGVYGHNESTDAGGKGVFGSSPNGIAVEGLGGQVGVHGISAGDTGVKGEGVGIGVRAVSTLANHAGVGLRVDGRSVFRTAGVATVASGKKAVAVSLAGVAATDIVLATVQQTGGFYVKNAVAASGKFTIYLNKAPVSPETVKVAWFVISAS